MKRLAVFSPYWDTLGGGEKYAAAFMSTALDLGWRVDVAWQDQALKQKIIDRFGMDIDRARIKPDLYQHLTKGNLVSRYKDLANYEAVFWVSDGSLPLIFGKNKLLHFQVPFRHKDKRKIGNYFKKLSYSQIICNSYFTKFIIDKEFGLNSIVLYPPATMIAPKKKENIILSVGRFDNLLHSKRQDILVQSFKDMKLKRWKLILAGGLAASDTYIKKLKKTAAGQAIEFKLNISWEEMVSLYAKSKIYWHAAGYGFDLEKNPQKAEHFGIATVEAMSAGAVPVVFEGGGQPEIVSHDKNGYLWQKPSELEEYTLRLIKSRDLWSRFSDKARRRSRSFDLNTFEKHVQNILS